MLIPFPDLLQRHSFIPKGILHIGASTGQESDWYAAVGVENVIWIEAIPNVFEKLKENISCYPKNIAFNKCISDVDYQSVEFNISSNGGESSSIFDFDLHTKFHPDVTFVDKINLTTIRVDTLLNTKEVDIRDYDYLSCDLQGSELAALKSMGDMLRVFKYIYVEVNKTPMYRNIPLVGEIDDYLDEFGFEPVDEKYTGAGWGDKFYIKKKNMNSVFSRNARQFRTAPEGVVEVPKQFMVAMPFHYPQDNHIVFEKWYYDTFKDKSERLYLPVQWTGYHVTHNYGNDKKAVASLQGYIDGLDRSKKYYTICQFDLGCMVDFKDLDILVFGMAGGRIDYCLPLLCMPHKFEFDNPKTLFANFIGRKTHPVREKVIEGLRHRQGCYVSEASHDLSAYCSIISSSLFTIAPRGFSSTSFRVLEALQYGSIPVIVTDELLVPHGARIFDYAIVIPNNEAEYIYDILQEVGEDEIKELQSKLKYYFEFYFTYSSNKRLISERLKNDNGNNN